MKNILVIAPHPDDEIVGLGITIKKILKKRNNIVIFFPTNGVIAMNQMWFWTRHNYIKNLSERISEMKSSLKQLGIENFFLQDIPTRTLKDHIKETYLKISNLIKKNKIDTIFCPAYEGGHQDHDVTNFICSKFKKKLMVFEFAEYNYFKRKINTNEFVDKTTSETNLILNENERLEKQELLNIYNSEKKNLSFLSILKESYRELIDYNYALPPHTGTVFYRRFSYFSWHPRVDSDNPNVICEVLTKYKNL